MSSRTRRVTLALVVAVVVIIGFATLRVESRSDTASEPGATPTAATPPAVAPAVGQPNVILFLTDDLDRKLMPYMPFTRHYLRDKGAMFDRYYVEQSTCCPSRATILSGQYSHNHGVLGNHAPEGGFLAWRGHGETRALPTWLKARGYRSALLGKYLNEYPYPASYAYAPNRDKKAARRYVPPGWDSWVSPVRGDSYSQFGYGLNIDGRVDTATRPNYLDGDLGRRLTSMIGGADGMDFREGGKFAYYSSYSPHTPYGHPARFDSRFKNVHYPHVPSFNEDDVTDKFGISRHRSRLVERGFRRIDRNFRDRIRSVQVLDKTVKRTVQQLRAQGTLDNTYLIFTSDNGYNMGEHRLNSAKYNQFQETVNLPLFIRGPGIKPGTVVEDLAGNIDLAPTIAEMTGATVPYPVDGISLLPRLTGAVPSLDRDALLISRGLVPMERQALSPLDEVPESKVFSPKRAQAADFNGVVTKRWKLVDYVNSSHYELYDLRNDPYELKNQLPYGAASYNVMLPPKQKVVRILQADLKRLMSCAGSTCSH